MLPIVSGLFICQLKNPVRQQQEDENTGYVVTVTSPAYSHPNRHSGGVPTRQTLLPLAADVDQSRATSQSGLCLMFQL